MLQKGRRKFMNSIIMNFDDNADMNSAYIQLKKLYPKSRIAKTDIDVTEMLEDEYLLALAEERLKSNKPTVSQRQMRKKLGITQKDIDEAEADFD